MSSETKANWFLERNGKNYRRRLVIATHSGSLGLVSWGGHKGELGDLKVWVGSARKSEPIVDSPPLARRIDESLAEDRLSRGTPGARENYGFGPNRAMQTAH